MATIRFLVLSDTHDSAFPDPSTLPTVDVVLHCGDLTQVGSMKRFGEAVERLAACDAELKLAIPGNHDLELDPEWWAKELEDGDDPELPQKAAALFTAAGGQGVRLLEEGLHHIALKDGRSFRIYASPYTPEFNGYAFAYGPQEDRFNSGKNPIPDDVDVVMTHGPPTAPGCRLDVNFKSERCGCPKLWEAIKRVQPRVHCFGHIHEAYGAQTATWGGGGRGVVFDDVPHAEAVSVPSRGFGKTLLLNAAIMIHGDAKSNAPFVLEMPLP